MNENCCKKSISVLYRRDLNPWEVKKYACVYQSYRDTNFQEIKIKILTFISAKCCKIRDENLSFEGVFLH